jgi:hypothetical protein
MQNLGPNRLHGPTVPLGPRSVLKPDTQCHLIGRPTRSARPGENHIGGIFCVAWGLQHLGLNLREGDIDA